MGTVKKFIRHNFRHFNSAVVVDASEAYVKHIARGDKMMITLAGAMSTAELGVSLAEMIRKDKVHAITCTGANLEEDIFNLVANKHYVRVPNYRNLSDREESQLLMNGMNRVTDTCIPEEEAFGKVDKEIFKLWKRAEGMGERHFPYEYMYQLIREGTLKKHYQIDPKHSWLIAACEKNLPIWTPGWEDSTLGNILVAHVVKGRKDPKKGITDIGIVRSGLEQFSALIDWYLKASKKHSVGFFQIGGGIAGDFPICVVPLIRQELNINCKHWGYFCQISDSTTSYGSYSGAVPNEKITWDKIGVDTPRFVIESDATIVAPLMFAYVLDH